MAVVAVTGQYSGGKGVPSARSMRKGGRTWFGGHGMGRYYDPNTDSYVEDTYPEVVNPAPGAVPNPYTDEWLFMLGGGQVAPLPAVRDSTVVNSASNAALYNAIGAALGVAAGTVSKYVINRNPPGNGQGYYEIRDPRTGAIQTYVQPLGNTGNILSRQELGGSLSGSANVGVSGGSTMLVIAGLGMVFLFMMMQQRR